MIMPQIGEKPQVTCISFGETGHEVSIRRAQSDDAAAMRDVAGLAYDPYVSRIGRRPAPMTCDLRRSSPKVTPGSPIRRARSWASWSWLPSTTIC